MKPVTLPKNHYAAAWSDQPRPVEDVNQLGYDYAILPDGAQKEEKALEIVRSFHAYVMKYVAMIHAGHVPMWGNQINKDAQGLLRFFLPKGSTGKHAYFKACRTLHLAFQRMEVEEIYDILVTFLLRAARGYDPLYTTKIKQVVDVVQSSLMIRKKFDATDFDELDFDCDRYLRKLCKSGFLVQVLEGGKIAGYQRNKGNWPPPGEFFKSGPIGFTYYIQQYFRYYLQEYVDSSIGEIEGTFNVMQLEHRGTSHDSRVHNAKTEWGRNHQQESWKPDVMSQDGQFTNHRNQSFAADVELSTRQMDVSKMTLDWIQETDDPIFSELSREERNVLYLRFNREMNWESIGQAIGADASSAKKQFDSIISCLRKRVELTVR